LLLSRLERLAPWPVSFIDPAPAIARRVVELIGPPSASAIPSTPASAEITFTSGKPPSEALKATLARFGFASISQ
jgi:glutamate racemase